MIPTKKGDVLIIRNDSIPTFAIAVVVRDGEQDLTGRTDQVIVKSLEAAVAYARVFTTDGGGRVFVINADTGEWSSLG